MNTSRDKKYSAVVLVQDQNHNYLLHLRDGNTKVMTNQWSFPGGAIENNETPKSAAVRELKEETNLAAEDISEIACIPYDADWNTYIFLAQVNMKNQKVKVGEGADLKFFSKTEVQMLLTTLNYTNPFLEFIKKYIAGY
ncbi:NUDIX hydrolase [Candidatus Woesebacteria bacterium]|nr:NUDIX hydrolase [Candidatus Woesebacteria bacterium]